VNLTLSTCVKKVQRAEEAIVRRIEELAFDPRDGHEGQALVERVGASRDCKKRPAGHPPKRRVNSRRKPLGGSCLGATSELLHGSDSLLLRN